MPRRYARIFGVLLSAMLLLAGGGAPQQAVRASPSDDSALVILQRYARAWRGRQELELEGPLLIEVSVSGPEGGEYNIVLPQTGSAVLREGAPAEYDISFSLDIHLLRRLDAREVNALTAMGQAKDSDPIPLNPTLGPRFERRPDASLVFRRVSFHFWNRDWPETVRFGERAARLVHGGNAVVLVYDQQFRSAWYQLKPGMHINSDPADRSNDFPQLLVVTRGRCRGRFDGRERALSEGEAIFVPAGMTHELWAEGGEYAEITWTAFGKGA
jgi:mannose-6-phosphate isomerase-like protein (cupin superfamily)